MRGFAHWRHHIKGHQMTVLKRFIVAKLVVLKQTHVTVPLHLEFLVFDACLSERPCFFCSPLERPCFLFFSPFDVTHNSFAAGVG